MKKLIILLLAGIFMIPAYAQRGKKDIVYLKSGGIIKGQLITNDAEIVKINSAGNEWVFKIADVDSVSKFTRATRLAPKSDVSYNYFFDTSMGVLVGNSGNNQSAPFSFMSSVNFKVTDLWYAGLGLGAEFFDETYMPAFAQIQYKFRNTRFTPFINLQVGYQVPLEEGNRSQSVIYYDYSSVWPGPQSTGKLNTNGGFMFHPSLGFQRFTSENFGWFFSFGYRYQQLNYSGEKSYKLETNYSRLSLKIGFIFN